jgi:hypothetical protein
MAGQGRGSHSSLRTREGSAYSNRADVARDRVDPLRIEQHVNSTCARGWRMRFA